MADKLEIVIGAKNLTARVFRAIGRSLKSLGSGIKRFATSSVRNLRNLSVAATAAFVAMIKGAADFRGEMAQVNTLLEGDSIDKFTKEVIGLSAELGVAKKELTQGLYQALSAGIPEDNAIEFLREAAKAAIGGATDIETAVDGITTVLNAYGMEASKAGEVSDKFFQTVKGGKTTFGELSQNIGQVAGLAAQAGIDIDELFAATVSLTKQGISTDMAITGIRQAIVALLAPSKELSKEFKKAGTTGEELLKGGMTEAFQKVAEFAGGSATELQKLIPNIRALPAIIGVTGKNAEATAGYLNDIQKSAGEAGKAFDKMDKTRGWQRLWQSILAQITKVGLVVDDKLYPAVDKIGATIRQWSASDAGAEFFENLTRKAEKLQKLVSAIFSGDDQARTTALNELADAGSDFATKVIDVFTAKAGEIGAAIWEGFRKARTQRVRSQGQARAELEAEGAIKGRGFGDIARSAIGGFAMAPTLRKQAEEMALIRARGREIRGRSGSGFTTTAGLTQDAIAIVEAIQNVPSGTAEAIKASDS